MNENIKDVIQRLDNTLNGEPWFGRSARSLLHEIDPELVFRHPGNNEHSIADLLWHMITWAHFTLDRLEKNKQSDMDTFETPDWRAIEPKIHSWEKGLNEFDSVYKKIIRQLKTKEDSFLKEKVDYRHYNFQFLLNGLIEHTIYHLGQIAYIHKLIS